MGNFDTSRKITGISEAGYANNPHDKGGETMLGISRKFWPYWPGWGIVDSFKGQPDFLPKVNTNLQLRDLARAFYKQNFWDVNKLDQINDQRICDTVYDFGVTSYTATAAKFLQRALGIIDDGIIGKGTISAVNAVLNPKDIYDKFNAARKQFYIDLAKKPGQEEFLHSWLSRLKPYQK